MNKKLLFATPLLVLGFHGTSQVTAQVECEVVAVPPVCQAGSRININTDSKNISPRNLCVTPGQTIQVNVTPSGSTASIDGKNGGWPSGSGSSFTLVAPNDGEHDYNVRFPDGTCIDPRITVKR